MIDLFIQPFLDFEFMRRALFGCVVIAIGASPLGVFLMLRRMSLTGDAMAHAILPGAAVGSPVLSEGSPCGLEEYCIHPKGQGATAVTEAAAPRAAVAAALRR